MDVREKLVELQSIITCPNAICNFCEHFKNKSACERHKKEVIADNMIAHGVTVQECKVAEIDQFKLPIDDAILILKEEYKQRVDGYTTHLSYGGNGDSAEEVHIDALGMAIAALELQKQTFLHHRKEND